MSGARPLEILIVDDNKIDREAIRRCLNPSKQGENFIVHEADGGRDGLALIRSRTFDCVFLDYLLPDMDGLRLLREVYNPATDLLNSPVVMLTGQGNETVMLEALRLGAQDYLLKDNIKPAALNIALKKSREIFELKQSRRRAEEQIQHMQKLEAVGQLTSGIAHDFNNLLTVVLGNLHLLQQRIQARPDKIDPDYALRKIQTMETVARNGAELVKRLMVFTRQRPLQQKKVNINDCINDVYELLKRSIGEAVEIRVTAAGDAPPVVIDPAELGNALINLAVNARDAMPGGGMLAIETSHMTLDHSRHPDVPPGAYTVIAVSDTGIGMSPGTARRIFDPFFTTKPVGQGTGLGLAICYRIVHEHGGTIQVASEPGKGTRFTVILPVAGGATNPLNAIA